MSNFILALCRAYTAPKVYDLVLSQPLENRSLNVVRYKSVPRLETGVIEQRPGKGGAMNGVYTQVPSVIRLPNTLTPDTMAYYTVLMARPSEMADEPLSDHRRPRASG